jgi:glycosyl transferase family 25
MSASSEIVEAFFVMTMLPAYVIHSRALPERAGHIRRELDRDEITPEVDALYFAPAAPLSIRQKSCALKHVAAMQRICARQQDLALIFEDDAQLVPDFNRRLRAVLAEAERWPRPRILHLGAATNFYTPASHLKSGESVYAGNRVRNMEAYVLGAREAAARLDWIARHPMRDPIDIAFNTGDPAMGIPFLWPEPPLAEQGSLNGAFPSSLASKGHSQTRLRVQFAVQKFKRRYLKRWLRRATS